MTAFPPEQADALAAGLARILGRPGTPGEICFLRCLDEAVIVDLCARDSFSVPGWEIRGVTAQPEAGTRCLLADQAVEIREEKGTPFLFLIDALNAGAGLDGIYNACREIAEEQFYDEAVKLLRKKMRGWTAFADDAIKAAQKMNGRSKLAPRQRFEFHAVFASSSGSPRGKALATIGLWPIALGDSPRSEDLVNSSRMVEKLLLTNANRLTPVERVRSLLLPADTPAATVVRLETFAGSAAARNTRDAVRELAEAPELWLNAIHPAFGTNELREVAIVPWRGANGMLYKWSGLVAGSSVPEFLINDDARLDVRWKVQPEDLQSGAVDYQVSIRSGNRDLATQVQSHTGKPQQTCRFSQDDFADLAMSDRHEVEIVVSVLGNSSVRSQKTEPFQLMFGGRPETSATPKGGMLARAAVDAAILCETHEDFRDACHPDRLSSAKDTIGFRPLKAGRGFRIPRPALLRQAEESWFQDAVPCRWALRVRGDGSSAGDLERIELPLPDGDDGAKLKTVSIKFAKATHAATGGLGLAARIYADADTPTNDYLREWATALESHSPQLALAFTVTVESLSGELVGLIVLPMHPLRVAWHAGYDLLAQHARYVAKEDPKSLGAALAALDAASFPMMLPGLRDGETFVYGDMLGHAGKGRTGNAFHAVGMVRAADPEPRAAVAALAQCYLGENRGTASPAGHRAADLLAAEIGRYRQYHSRERTKFLHLHSLRPGDGSILAGALGWPFSSTADAAETDHEREFGYVLRLHPADATASATGRFFTRLNEQRRSGSKSIPPDLRWIHDSFSLNGQHRLPRLRWYKVDPNRGIVDSVHLSIAFDTFATEVSALSAPEMEAAEVKQPRHGYGLIHCPRRQWSFAPPRSRVSPARGFEGKSHPYAKGVTDRLERLHAAAAKAVARHLDTGGQWPVMQATLAPEREAELAAVHGLSDWVITLDRHAAVEYFDSPRESGPIYDSYVIDCRPERDDLGSLQMITSTSNLHEVRGLLDKSLAEMGLSSSRHNCDFLLRQLKALSGRLAIRLVSDSSQQEIIALAMVHAQCYAADNSDTIWSPLAEGFFLPLDDLRDLAPAPFEPEKMESEDEETFAAVPRSRADLVYVTAPKRGAGLEFRFVEVKYRRTLSSARSGTLAREIAEQIDRTAEGWQAEYTGDTLGAFFRRSRLYRALRFYADKARRHALNESAYAKILAQIDRLLTDERTTPLVYPEKNRGFIFCPDYRADEACVIREPNGEAGIYLFGPRRLPDWLGQPVHVHEPVREAAAPTINEGEAPTPEPVIPEAPSATVPVPEPPLVDALVSLGTASDGSAVDWSVSIRGNPHLMIVGLPGMGKTTAVMSLCASLSSQGVVPLVFSYHQDIDEKLVPVLPGTRLLSPFDIGFDPMRIESPKEFAHIDRAAMLRDIFAAIFPGLGEIQETMVYDAIKKTYTDRGWSREFDAGCETPPFRAFFELLKRDSKPDKGRAGLVGRLTELDDYGLFAGGAKSHGLLDSPQPCILQIHATPSEILQRAFASLMLQKLYQDMFRRGVQKRITHAVIFDEAHRASRLKLIPTMAKECRKYGIALILASQEAKDFDDSLYSAVGNFLVLKVAEPDARRLARNLVPTDREKATADRLKQLPKFHAMFRGGDERPRWIQLADFTGG